MSAIRFFHMVDRRIIGIDYGTRRVGIAMADPLRLFSQPVGTFDPDLAIEKLVELNDDLGIECIVMGWPVLPDVSKGIAAHRVEAYMRRIRNRLPDIQIVTWNEEYTSEIAKEMIASGERPSMRHTGRDRIDTAAAAIILQEFLDQGNTVA